MKKPSLVKQKITPRQSECKHLFGKVCEKPDQRINGRHLSQRLCRRCGYMETIKIIKV